jgi:hypothetical protein
VFSLNLRPSTGPYLRDCVERPVPMATSCPTRGMQPWPSNPVASGLPLIETTRASQAYDGVFHPDGGAEDAVERNIPVRWMMRPSNPSQRCSVPKWETASRGCGSKSNDPRVGRERIDSIEAWLDGALKDIG